MNKHKEEIDISIIVPVYNAEKYLKECVESILEQDLKNFELIFVENGSSDSSLNILQEYAQRDCRIVILICMRRGAANARNLGMKIAKGEYLIFLDSDDVFEKDMLSSMYHSAKVHSADVVICEFDKRMKQGNSRGLEVALKKQLCKYAMYPFKLQELNKLGLKYWIIAPWNKLINREFIVKYNLEFQNLKSANDFYFSIMVMILAERIIHINSFKPMVHYRVNTNNQISANRNVYDVYAAMKKLYIELNQCHKWGIYYEQLFIAFYLDIIYGIEKGEVCSNKKFYNFFLEEGAEEIGIKNVRDGNNLGEYRKLPSFFYKNSYDSGWFKEAISFYLMVQDKGLCEIRSLSKKKCIAIWGAGKQGKALINICEKNNVKIMYVIDMDKALQGKYIGNKVVVDYEKIKNEVDVIIVNNKDYLDSICERVYSIKKEKVQILPLFTYVQSDLKLEDCIFKISELVEPFE